MATLRRNLAILLPELKAFARSLGCASEDVDDVAHSAIERALNASDPPQAIDALRPWMFRTIRNLHTDAWRRKRRESTFVEDAAYCASQRAGYVKGADTDALVRLALAQMSPSNREILLLVDVLGLKYAECAAALDIPLGTVMSRVSRARGAMIARLGELDAAKSADRGT